MKQVDPSGDSQSIRETKDEIHWQFEPARR
jgi:hypothetical protein